MTVSIATSKKDGQKYIIKKINTEDMMDDQKADATNEVELTKKLSH